MIFDRREFARLFWIVLSISALGWLALLIEPRTASCCCSLCAPTLAASFRVASPGALSLDWALMLVAMMAPTLVPAIYQIQLGSFARRRLRNIALFLAAYGVVWLLAGAVLVALGVALKSLWATSWVVVLASALVWQVSPFKQRCLNRCHNHRPLPAFGLAADCAAARLGYEHGLWCVGSCWLMMTLPMLIPGGEWSTMIAVNLWMFCERLDPPRPPSWGWHGFAAVGRSVHLRWFCVRAELDAAPRSGLRTMRP